MSDVIRYIDSAGWHWQVCEVADRRRQARSEAPAEDPAEDQRSARPAVSAPLADALPADTRPADARPADDDDPPGQLYFFSRLGTRRTRRYPAAWPSLPIADLEALCLGAQVLGVARLG